MKVLASHKNYELKYDEETGIVCMKFKGDMTDEIYREFWTKAIDFGIEKKINRVIIDQQEIGNVSFISRGWVAVNAFPRVKKHMPNNLSAAILSSNRLVQKSGMQYLLKAFVGLTGYHVEAHSTIEEAIDYLKRANERFMQRA